MKDSAIIKLGALCAAIACLGEFVVEFYAASQIEGYSNIGQTISYLGHTDSPMNTLITVWGGGFALLFVLFAIGFGKAFRKFKYSGLAVILILIYGIAQGIGAAYFPIDLSSPDQNSIWNLHNFLSGFGDAALVVFPFVMMGLFRTTNKKALRNTVLIACWGLLFVFLFLGANYVSDSRLGNYKGLLQRSFQFIYYGYFIFITIKMFNRAQKVRD